MEEVEAEVEEDEGVEGEADDEMKSWNRLLVDIEGFSHWPNSRATYFNSTAVSYMLCLSRGRLFLYSINCKYLLVYS